MNEWESNLEKGLIKENEFLTRSTSEGLRISLTSTIQLVEYLLNECGFSYVLTAKFNQDSLEVIKLFLLPISYKKKKKKVIL